MLTSREETLEITIASPGDSGQVSLTLDGFLCYLEIVHPGVGDPDFALQVLNSRGTVVWDSDERVGHKLTGDSILFIGEEIPTKGHKLKIKGSTLAGLFNLYALLKQ